MPTAVITGASSGIGAAIAARLAKEGYDLVLVARRADRLIEQAVKLRTQAVKVQTVAVDLMDGGAFEKIQAVVPAPNVLINNAGMGLFGRAEGHSVADQLKVVRLNCESLTELTLGFLPAMVERGSGVVVNLGSVAGLQPVPYFAVYAATKAYVHSLSEALDEEFGQRGVRFVIVAPGPVPTEFQGIAGSPDANLDHDHRSPEQIAEETWRAIKRPRRLVVPVAKHRFMHFMQRFVPRSAVLAIAAKKMQGRGLD
tara:strand:- start:186 stop:950 length:765 start_codon:yes stop_codon:yes gene_type:complete